MRNGAHAEAAGIRLPPAGQATIYDVAQLARVSASTVSHVINRTRRVGRPTRERVEAAIVTLGYRRNALANALASSLRGRRTRTIGLIIQTIVNPLQVEIARGAEDAASEAGYALFLCNTDEQPDKQTRYIEMLLEHRVAGILIGAAPGTSAEVARLQQTDVPLVAVGYFSSGVALDTVRLDYAQGSRLAVEHLVAQGHRRIAVMLSNTDPTQIVAERRLRGYFEALHAAGIAADPALIVLSPDIVEDARDAADRFLAADTGCTAIISFAPPSTLGLLCALRERGIPVPADVSVIGFGDAMWMRAYAPPITAIVQPNYDVGRRAAELLLRRLAENESAAAAGDTGDAGALTHDPSDHQTLYIPTHLVPRDSVAARARPVSPAAAVAGATG